MIYHYTTSQVDLKYMLIISLLFDFHLQRTLFLGYNSFTFIRPSTLSPIGISRGKVLRQVPCYMNWTDKNHWRLGCTAPINSCFDDLMAHQYICFVLNDAFH